MKSPGRVALALSAVLLAPAAWAQIPIAGELQVNSSPGGPGHTEVNPDVAADAQGRFVVVWARWNGFTHTVLGRRFDVTGLPEGPEFTINTGAVAINDRSPEVSYEANGGFVVVWPGAGSPAGSANVVGRRYDSTGVPRGPEFLVATSGTQLVAPRVSAGNGGGFVVSWRVDTYPGALFARPYDASGTGMGIVTVTSGGGSQGGLPDVTMVPSGGFTVAWAPNANPQTVWARQFDAAGAPLGLAFPVAAGGEFRNATAIVSDASGRLAVGWHEWGTVDDRGPVVRMLAADGTPRTGEITPSTFTPGVQSGPFLATVPSGEVIATWVSQPLNINCPPPPFPCTQPPPQDGSGSGIFGRLIDASGDPVGGEFAVNAYTTGNQAGGAVAADEQGHFVIVWEDPRNIIVARRFALLSPSALVVDPVPTSGANGNKVLEAGETVAVEPAWRNTAGVAVTYSAATASLGGPAGGTYSMPDPDAAYGTIPPGASRSCRDELDCYGAAVAGPRPAPHWDALLTEILVGGPTRTWAVHVGESFADVPMTSPFYRFVETVFHGDVMGGCAAGSFCPTFNVPREHMPVFVLQSYDPAFLPPPCVAGGERFADVPASSPYCRWIEELARRGIVTGCGGGYYCPELSVSRETMAVYLLATLGVNPPACGAPLFADVPSSSPFCRWIEELARRGVVGGCGPATYCPTLAVARDQMSVFLTGTFSLALYGP